MNKNLKGNALISHISVCLGALMMLVGLSIPVADLWDSYSSFYYLGSYSFNGFNTLGGHTALSNFSGAVAAINWILLLSALTCIGLAIALTFASSIYSNSGRKKKTELAIVITGLICAFLYMIEGICIVTMRATDYGTTYAPILFAMQLVFLICYFVFNSLSNKEKISSETPSSQKFYVNNSVISNPNPNVNSITQSNSNPSIVNNADEIMKYKQLLDMGAISQEDFDQKRKELLGL